MASSGSIQASGRFSLQQSSDDSRPAASRTSLHRRVQNVLRWRSWGEESDASAGSSQQRNDASLSQRPSAAGAQRHRGRSAGSDVELSALPSTSSISSGDTPGISMTGSGAVAVQDTLGSNKSSSSSIAGTGLPNDNSSAAAHDAGASSSMPAGQQHQHTGSGSAAADDACSIATQAGSTAHSFTSLYSMLADQGDQGSEAGGSVTAGSTGVAGGAASPWRGSEAGADVATSVSTLPLISEAAYDDEQQLLDIDELAEEGGCISGFEEQEDGTARQPGQEAAAFDNHHIVSSGISGRPRVSSSHGGSITSGTSDTSLPAAGSIAGSSASGPSVGMRIASPGAGTFARSGYGPQRSSSNRQNLYHQQQQQQQSGADNSGSGSDMPQPFGIRKRPDNDDTCSFATQAGSVHSVSSILSSAFTENAPAQRQLGSGQHQLIHPLSEPADELAGFEDEEDQEEDHEEEEEEEVHADGVSIAAATAGEGYSRLGSPISPRSSSSSHHHHTGSGRLLGPSWDLEQQPQQQEPQQQKLQQQQQGSLAGPHCGASSSTLERKGSLKGALRSVVAWGSGLGQRLHRGSHHQHGGYKQQQQQQGTQSSTMFCGVQDGQEAAGVPGRHRAAAGAGGQEMVSM